MRRKVKETLKVSGNMLVYRLSRTVRLSRDQASSLCISSMAFDVTWVHSVVDLARTSQLIERKLGMRKYT